MLALFQPYFGKHRKGEEDLLGYPHAWVGDRFAQPLRNLKAAAAQRGVVMRSILFSDSPDADIYFFWERPLPDEPLFSHAVKSGKPMILLATEPDKFLPMNGDPGNARVFDKVFTWKKDRIDYEKFFPIQPITFAFPERVDETPYERRKFLVLVSSVYTSSDLGELYSKRLETIRWFEENSPESLDWYGRNNRYSRIDSPLYRGETARKQEVLAQYRYCICYESTASIPGFITEKLFDALFAGTVPVYWGASDIADYVPENCFIDRRKFATHEELLSYLHSLTRADYLTYIENAQAFLKSDFARSRGEWALTEAILPVCFGDTSKA